MKEEYITITTTSSSSSRRQPTRRKNIKTTRLILAACFVGSIVVNVVIGIIGRNDDNGIIKMMIPTSQLVDEYYSTTASAKREPHSNKKRTTISIYPDRCTHTQQQETKTNFDKIYQHPKRWGPAISRLKPEDYYSNAKWPPVPRQSPSGIGSNLGHETETSLRVLRDTIKKYNVSTMIDIPCGDVNWIFDSYETDAMMELYIGLDIVKPLIDINVRRFAHHSNKIFRHWDGVKCPLPKISIEEDDQSGGDGHLLVPVDLVHSRDVIQHLNPEDGVHFLCNVLSSGARVLVTTTFPNGENKEIVTGEGFFYNSLTSPPYDMPESTNCIPTHPKHEPDHTCVYDLTESWVEEWIKKKKCV